LREKFGCFISSDIAGRFECRGTGVLRQSILMKPRDGVIQFTARSLDDQGYADERQNRYGNSDNFFHDVFYRDKNGLSFFNRHSGIKAKLQPESIFFQYGFRPQTVAPERHYINTFRISLRHTSCHVRMMGRYQAASCLCGHVRTWCTSIPLPWPFSIMSYL
jgi:hypothetical protein